MYIGIGECHPKLVDMMNSLRDSNAHAQQVAFLLEIERASEVCRGCSVTFCKSGKDRTGMVVTYRQARKVDSVMYEDINTASTTTATTTTTSSPLPSSSPSSSTSSIMTEQHNAVRVSRIADYFRLYGCRLSICEKNIGKREYAMNAVQCQFLPAVFKPPSSTMGDILRDHS
jgi:hypothetical protein